ncbi:LysR family transcriptional regulator [Bordetella genomosp. 12]|uniref:LysR family transcriptional regulator n=1 Tax=Bordetella genomosp. 12 TaxID=463035 RepID=A0A261VD37_9BORD|nr:LysR family transcriptional regulator [Bordetella genomosp. 12]OZI71925.1 LysR family transcriptional regulator [Bordetella genomosp. 12]
MKTAGLNLDHLRVLLDVMEQGSFSLAAERHGLSQPAVSQQVRQLERRFGLRLIERMGRRASATAAGQELAGHLRGILAAVDDADRAMQSLAAGVTGRVRLGTGATACTYLLPPLLASLRQRFPDLDVVVSVGNTADLLRDIEDNRLDVGLLTMPIRARTLLATPILEDEFVAIFPASGPAPAARLTPRLLTQRPLVLFEPGAQTRALVDGWFGAAGLSARPTMELGSTEAMKEIVGAGLGCAVLPRMAVSGAGARPGLLTRPLQPRLGRKLAMVTRRDKPVSRGLRQVLDGLLALKPPGDAP